VNCKCWHDNAISVWKDLNILFFPLQADEQISRKNLHPEPRYLQQEAKAAS
jgi:hypothetical protein